MKDQREDNINPTKTFRSINWKHSEQKPNPYMADLRKLSGKLNDGTITWEERMLYAIILLKREADGYLGRSFYEDHREYLKNSLATVLEMDHSRPVKPINITPNVDFLTDEDKWILFENGYESTTALSHYPGHYKAAMKDTSERPDK